jgi:hypothetical protein
MQITWRRSGSAPDVRSAQIMTRRDYQGSSRLKWVFVGVAESMRIGSPATSTNDARSTNKARVCKPFTLHVILGTQEQVAQVDGRYN